MNQKGRRATRAPENLRPFPLPREHGAWALLYGPFLFIVFTLAKFNLNLLLLSLALTFLFFAHEPLSRLVRMNLQTAEESRKSYWWRWFWIYLTGGTVSGAVLIWHRQLFWLIPMGAALLGVLTLHLFLIAGRKEKFVAGELLGVVGLTASAPVTYYVAHRTLDAEALVLWMLNILYFSSAIFYVKMVVSRHVASRQEEAGRRSRQCILYHSLLVLVVGVLIWLDRIPLWTFLAFLPITIRALAGTTSGKGRLNLKRIGYTEVLHTVFFIAVMVLVWRTAG